MSYGVKLKFYKPISRVRILYEIKGLALNKIYEFYRDGSL